MTGARPELRTALRRCGLLAVFSVVLWGLLLYPAYAMGGRDGVQGLTFAAALCLIPGWLVLLIGSRFTDAGSQMPMVVLGGSALRMLFVLVGMLVVRSSREDLQFHEFVLWLLVFYLAMLAVETRWMLKVPSASQDISSPENSEIA